MKTNYSEIIISLIILTGISSAQDNQQTPQRNYIYYDSEDYTCKFTAPEHWKFDLENAQLGDYSAALFPDTNQYYDSEIIIYIWIFGSKQYNYQQFISYDSAAYIKGNPEIKFMHADSVKTSAGQTVLYFETADPGGKYDLAAVGYIPAGKEIIVYEMDIKNRSYFSDAQFAIRDALAGFELIEKKE